MIAIPTDIGHWSYHMHARARISRNTHVISFLLLFAKAIMVPIGFSYYKSLDASCTASYNYLYEVMYVIIMIYMVSFTIVGVVSFFWVDLVVSILKVSSSLQPCCLFAVEEMPAYHGVSTKTFKKLPSMIFSPNRDDADQTEVPLLKVREKTNRV